MNRHSPTRLLPRVRPLAASVFILLSGQGFCTGIPDGGFDDRGGVSLAQRYADAMTFGYADSLGPSPQASTIFVQNCNDAGSGSLREAIGAAQSGDTVDLSHLSCARITLTTGQIIILQENLTIAGSGADQITIDGGASANHFNRIFMHEGTGTLHVNQVTLADAKYKANTQSASGGCINSDGSVSLSAAKLTGCFAELPAANPGAFSVFGGAINAQGVVLLHSTVSGNFAVGPDMHTVNGGGIYCRGNLTIKYSSVTHNSASGNYARYGGIGVQSGDVYIMGSTLSDNSAQIVGAIGISEIDHHAHTVQILNTTISGNHATIAEGGIAASYADVTVANSTITRNFSDSNAYGSGLRTIGPQSIRLESSIIANNTSSTYDSDAEIDMRATVTGSSNLITQSEGHALPAGTISACPLIGPLGDHGGETQTHQLSVGSPALNAGNNTERGFDYDQRGTGYPREFGGQADIGAYEDHGVPPDQIFSGQFEGRCR